MKLLIEEDEGIDYSARDEALEVEAIDPLHSWSEGMLEEQLQTETNE